jgi:hypothetical protein
MGALGMRPERIQAGRLIYSGLPLPWCDRAFLHDVREGLVEVGEVEAFRIGRLVHRYGKGARHVVT